MNLKDIPVIGRIFGSASDGEPGALRGLDLTAVSKVNAAKERAADIAKQLGHADSAIATISAIDPSAYIVGGSAPNARFAEAPAISTKPSVGTAIPQPPKPAVAPAPATPQAAKPAAEPIRAAPQGKVLKQGLLEGDKAFLKRLGTHIETQIAQGTLDAHGIRAQQLLTDTTTKLAAGEHAAAKEAYNALMAHQKDGLKLAKQFKTPGFFKKWGTRGVVAGAGIAGLGVAYNLLKRPDISIDKEKIADLNDKIAENEAKLVAMQTMAPQAPMQQAGPVMMTPQGPVMMVPANSNLTQPQYQGPLVNVQNMGMGAPA